MADKKISALDAATTPLAGTEVLPIVQSSTTKKVAVSNLTAGRAISATSVTASTGNFILGAAGQGIDFSINPSAAGMTSELLNDYEEGTWTPSVSGNGGGDSGQVYATQTGYYTKVGNVVTCYFKIVLSTKGTMNGGAAGITGIPYTAKSNSLAFTVITNSLVDGTRLTFCFDGAGTGFNYLPFSPANINDTSSFEGSVTYQVA
jgi:hypothetical protein